MRVLLAGAGAVEALATPVEVRGWSRFSRAAVVRVPEGVVVLAGPGSPPGPLQVLVDELPRSPTELAGLDLRGAQRWFGALPHRARLAPPGAAAPAGRTTAGRATAGWDSGAAWGAAWGAATEAATEAARANLIPAGRREAARAALLGGDLRAVAAALGGAGPGLTPAGDDALCGLFFALRARAGPGAEAWLRPLAAGVVTTDLSGAALAWAARGQALAPAHEVLAAAAGADPAPAWKAAGALAAVGHSSGADFAWGLAAGLASGLASILRETTGRPNPRSTPTMVT